MAFECPPAMASAICGEDFEELNKAAIISLGANLERPLEMIETALAKLAETGGLKLLAASGVYLTEPQGGPPDQNWYHNAVAFFKSELKPHDLLAVLMGVEKELGRQRLVHWGPRVIDLDFIAQGDLVIDDPPALIVPHPRMSDRLFVLAPLAEVAPGWRHPLDGRSAAELLAGLDGAGQGFKKLAAGKASEA